jgi:dUTP pyrophosphatase
MCRVWGTNGIVPVAWLATIGYQGEIFVSTWNRSREVFTLNPLDRLAQLVVVPVVQVAFNIVDAFPESLRGEGGFGSTGKR